MGTSPNARALATVAAAVSGVASAILLTPNFPGRYDGLSPYWFPGVLFGLAVSFGRQREFRALIARCLCSGMVWAAMYFLGIVLVGRIPAGLAGLVAGGLGGLLVLVGFASISGSRPRSQDAAICSVVGALAGAIFGFLSMKMQLTVTIHFDPALTAAFVVWQVPMAWILEGALARAESPNPWAPGLRRALVHPVTQIVGTLGTAATVVFLYWPD